MAKRLTHAIPTFTWVLATLVVSLLTTGSARAQEHFTGCAFNTGGSATVVIETIINPTFFDVPLEPGDEIAAFTESGICAGVAVWVGGGTNVALTAWGDNAVTPEVDGFTHGEELAFRIWSTFFEEEGGIPPTTVQVAYDDCVNRPPPCSDTGEYIGESLTFLSELVVTAQTTGATVPDLLQPPEMTVFPNPARHLAYISLSNMLYPSIRMSLLNTLGQTLRVETLATTFGSALHSVEVDGLPAGGYFLVIDNGPSRTVKMFAVIN